LQGPFKTPKEAEDAWKAVSEENRHKAGVRFSIVEEPEPRSSLDAASGKNGQRPHRLLGWGRRRPAQVIGNKGPLRRTWLLIS